MSRTENGHTVHSLSNADCEFVVADLAAKLAGVSLSTAVRVIAALDAIGKVHELEPVDLAVFEDTPVSLPNLKRAEDTEHAYQHVCDAVQARPNDFPTEQREKLRVE